MQEARHAAQLARGLRSALPHTVKLLFIATLNRPGKHVALQPLQGLAIARILYPQPDVDAVLAAMPVGAGTIEPRIACAEPV